MQHTSLTMEKKRAIAARMFYEDNKDQFKDYEEARKEIAVGSESAPPDDFINTMIGFMPLMEYIEKGYRMMIKDGNLIAVLISNGHMMPMTDMSHDDGMKIQKDFEQIAEQYPEIESAVVLLQKMGWVLV